MRPVTLLTYGATAGLVAVLVKQSRTEQREIEAKCAELPDDYRAAVLDAIRSTPAAEVEQLAIIGENLAAKGYRDASSAVIQRVAEIREQTKGT